MAKFRTKARTVDMLGRQQIADASTAISELFKNAHDAYADNVEGDFFRTDSLLVIRDDGMGMTPEEFESTWLVLGTDIKTAKTASLRPYRPTGKPKRAIMGEKGIGRLAIAFLGPQVLVLSRSERRGERDTLVMCYVHWGLFEQPYVNLDDVEIPIQRISGGELPSNRDVTQLLKENAANVRSLKKRFPNCEFDSILSDISKFQIDPRNFEQAIPGPSLADRNPGTHFYIAPTHDSIPSDIAVEQEGGSREFSKCLLGFCNSVFSEDKPPPIQSAFRYWKSDNQFDDLIEVNEFFTKDDIRIADQFVSGSIDEYGQFRGTVRVYEEQYPDHVISWKDSGGKPTACGPFRIEFGYLQGNLRDSTADPHDWASLNQKLKKIGGLYVYRDRIRILPYGNSDVDWIDIEERRSKGMTYYFFSYRRIYGAVSLTKADNATLREKAGREGFQKDKAYRQFKAVLENVFVQLAADFFRKDAPLGDYFNERKDELVRLALARKKREQQTTTKRNKLSNALDIFFSKTQDSMPQCEITALRHLVQSKMSAASEFADPDIASEELLSAEREANQRLADLKAAYTIARPRGVGLTKALTRDWKVYQDEHARLDQELFAPFAKEIADTLGAMAEQAQIYVDQRRRLNQLIQSVADKHNAAVRGEASALERATGDTRKAAINTARSAIRELRDVIEEVKQSLAQRDLTEVGPQQIDDIRVRYQERIDSVASVNTEKLASTRELLATITDSLKQRLEYTQLDMAEALETELTELRDQADKDEELVQLGLAIAVINHEFGAAIQVIRAELRELKSWAKVNDDLLPIYNGIRTNFDHLDAHLNLFTPLQRRLYRKRIDIRGSEIACYIRALFSARFERHRIRLDSTQDFLDGTVHSFPSTIYPVFVNLIDNFVFWLRDVPTSRVITLDYSTRAFHIENNGPTIARRDVEAIFEQGFSRKPGGRGMGLYISRKVLNKEGMALAVDLSTHSSNGACFVLSWDAGGDSDE